MCKKCIVRVDMNNNVNDAIITLRVSRKGMKVMPKIVKNLFYTILALNIWNSKHKVAETEP